MPRSALRQLRAVSRTVARASTAPTAGRSFASHVDLPPTPSTSKKPKDVEPTATELGRPGELQLAPAGPGLSPDPENKLDSISLADIYAAYAKLPARPPPLTASRPSWLPPDAFRDDPFVPRTKSRWMQGRNPVFLPNVTLTMVRPARHEAHNPYLAVFRCDMRLSKIDIFNYLRQIYGLQGITSIRTAIYRGRHQNDLKRTATALRLRVRRARSGNYKKVWVGLSQPFWYPPPRDATWLNEQFAFAEQVNVRDYYGINEDLRRDGVGKTKRTAGPGHARGYRPDILSAVMAQRAKRRAALDVENRLQSGQPIPAPPTTLEAQAGLEDASIPPEEKRRLLAKRYLEEGPADAKKKRQTSGLTKGFGGRKGLDGKLLELEGRGWWPTYKKP